MATGPAHYKAAEELIASAREMGMKSAEYVIEMAKQGKTFDPLKAMEGALAEAQVRATLALAAATALQPTRRYTAPDDVPDTSMPGEIPPLNARDVELRAWRQIAGSTKDGDSNG